MLSGIVILDRFVHCPNAPFPIVVTLLGISTLFSLEQRENASSPIVIIPLGIVMSVSFSHSANAL